MGLYITGRSHAERGMGFAQVNQASIVLEHFPVPLFTRPVELVDSITRDVTVVVATFRAQHFLTPVQKCYPLGGQDHYLDKFVHFHTIYPGII